MESSIVIKVKYGETLRRFNACVDENEELELDMEALRAKILILFNLAPDADLTLTYTDVDGDVVTLVDNSDLHDVVRQGLNPFRINVLVNNDKGSRSYARSSGSSTPMRSPRVQHPLPSISTSATELLSSVPEPFREAISKLSVDLASKAASSAPLVAELVDCLSKMGQSVMNLDSQTHVDLEHRTQSGPSQNNICSKDSSSLKDGGKLDAALSVKLADLTSKSSQKKDVVNVSRGVVAPVTRPHVPVDLNLDLADSVQCGTKVVNIAPASNVSAVDNKKEGSSANPHGTSGGIGETIRAANSKRNNFWGPSQGTDGSAVPPPVVYPSLLFGKRDNAADGIGGIFHRGVICDGCGVHPITGPRFKSKVKDDYDLCSICFSEMGNEVDYVRMDRPVSTRCPWASKGLHEPVRHSQFRVLPAPYLFKGGLKPCRPKLDSRFILDVNVMDGTVIAPSTSFTKIWRMRNCGGIVWPQGTRLVWIGGDRFSDAVSVDTEVPVGGVPVDEELDIAVDFTSPEEPGRYVSYWRMASPSGHKFGQRVWVLIQVDVSLKEPLGDSPQGLNLNFPPVTDGSKGPIIIDVNVEPVVDSGVWLPPKSRTDTAQGGSAFRDEQQPKDEQEHNFPISDALLVGEVSTPVPPEVSAPVPPEVSSPLSYPIIDMSDLVPPVHSQASAPIVDMPASSKQGGENNTVEQSLLKELEEMGFRQVDLNKEVLRMNDYNLEQSVDDLCGVAEWDPMLEELEEMGFYDREQNKRLLAKNNGSIKRVVMDLIAGEKA